ncbi:hypothetical protein CRI93_01825 [Longimonas halophila]|uniref:Flippase-like domain-containing protein n=1 Tax=Longimonas halophila TaxID=1469170 RepID=A0A2H3NQZ3_9BACT|nr:lysylphosphatidylglycerol synthase transmembrane domain-containing protein [Longimonas halophila]PEN09492.1 hypothetical protein CRI93_01825 [Longimonas halophila]
MPNLRAHLSTVVKAVLAVAVVGYLVLFVDPASIWATAQAANPWLLMLAALMVVPNLWADGRTWRVLMAPLMPNLNPRTMWRAVMAGFAVGFFTPARVGEYAGRAFSVSYPNKWSVTATVLLQRLIDLVVGLWMGTAVLAASWYSGMLPTQVGWGVSWGVVLGGGIGFATVVTLGLLVPTQVLRIAKRLPERWVAWSAHLSFLNRLSRRQVAGATAWAAFRYVVFIGQMALLVQAFDATVAFTGAAAGAALAYYIRYLLPSPTLMDLGVREGAAVFFLPFFGADPAAALNASLSIFALNIAAPSLVGAVFVRGLSLQHTAVSVAEAVPSSSTNESSSPA